MVKCEEHGLWSQEGWFKPGLILTVCDLRQDIKVIDLGFLTYMKELTVPISQSRMSNVEKHKK